MPDDATSTHLARPPLRLVGDAASRRRAQHATAVADENRAAARLAAADARRILALRVVRQLEGGRAAILRPAARRALLRDADHLGLRPFDASLVIAIVQDGARRGESTESDDVEDRLALVGPPARPPVARRPALLLTIACALGASVAAVLVAWVQGG